MTWSRLSASGGGACYSEMAARRAAGVACEREQRDGDAEATRVLLLTEAPRRGLDTRVGLEKALHEPNGERTMGNEALVRAARELGADLEGAILSVS